MWGKAFMAFPFELGCGCGGVECFSDSFADFFCLLTVDVAVIPGEISGK